MKNEQQKLKMNLEYSIKKLEKAKQVQKTILAQTVYLGSVGIIFILPVIVGAYLGVWLDDKFSGFSFSWTICLIFTGIIVGAVNVYYFMKE